MLGNIACETAGGLQICRCLGARDFEQSSTVEQAVAWEAGVRFWKIKIFRSNQGKWCVGWGSGEHIQTGPDRTHAQSRQRSSYDLTLYSCLGSGTYQLVKVSHASLQRLIGWLFVLFFYVQFSTNDHKACKKQGIMIHSKDRINFQKQSLKKHTVDLLDRDFRTTNLNIIKELKENTTKVNQENCIWIKLQYKQGERNYKNEPNRESGLKNTVTEFLPEGFNSRFKKAEEGISGLETGHLEYQVWGTKGEKKWRKVNREPKRLVRHEQANQYKHYGSSSCRREKGTEWIFEEIITENLPNLKKYMDINPRSLANPKIFTPRHILIKLLKIKEKEKSWVTYKRSPVRLSDFSAETSQPGRQQDSVF